VIRQRREFVLSVVPNGIGISPNIDFERSMIMQKVEITKAELFKEMDESASGVYYDKG